MLSYWLYNCYLAKSNLNHPKPLKAIHLMEHSMATPTFDLLDSVHDREVYLRARNASNGSNKPLILHYAMPSGKLGFSWCNTWEHWKTFELCRFVNGKETNNE